MRYALLAALCVTFAPLPALADVTARYQSGKDVFMVEADDSGDYRAGIAGKIEVIRRGGEEFVVIQEGGKPMVLRMADALSFASELFPADKTAPDKQPMKFLLTQTGEEKIAGRTGARWTLVPEGEKDPVVAVMTPDRDLVPIGDVFRLTIAKVLTLAVPKLGGIAGDLKPRTTELFAKGTPLRLAGPATLVLQSVDTGDIPATRFALPGPVSDAAALLQSMNSAPVPANPEP